MTTDFIHVPQAGALSDLAAWLAAADGPLSASLYTSNTPYLPTRVLSDYTLAAFTGYAPVSPIVWGAPFINGSGKAESDSNVLTWTFTGGSGTATVFGILFTDVGITNLRAVVPFLTPHVFSPSSRTLSFQAQLTEVGEL